MKLKFTRKTWYFFLLAAAAVSMLGGFAVLGGMDFSGLELVVFCLTGIAACFWQHRRVPRGRKAQLHAGVRAADAQQAGGRRLGGRPVLGTGVAWPAGHRVRPRQAHPAAAAAGVHRGECCACCSGCSRRYAGMSGLAFWTNIMFVLLACARGWAALTLYKLQEEEL